MLEIHLTHLPKTAQRKIQNSIFCKKFGMRHIPHEWSVEYAIPNVLQTILFLRLWINEF
jgi:hypothetical protein